MTLQNESGTVNVTEQVQEAVKKQIHEAMHRRQPWEHSMPLAAKELGLLWVVINVVGISLCAVAAGSVNPTLVEVWRVGDDAFTSGLRDSLESALKNSRDFTLSSGKKPGTLVVTIPRSVGWNKTSGGRTRVTYEVEFSSVNNKKVRTSTGSCSDDSIENCADQIVKEAKIAARKIR